jgi:hypothetical protein
LHCVFARIVAVRFIGRHELSSIFEREPTSPERSLTDSSRHYLMRK